jgi:hypothetical protein
MSWETALLPECSWGFSKKGTAQPLNKAKSARIAAPIRSFFIILPPNP